MCLLFAATPATFLVCDTLFHGPFLAHAKRPSGCPRERASQTCVCAAASAHPCDVCSPKKVTLLLIFCTYIYHSKSCGWGGLQNICVLCVYKPFFASSCVFRNPNPTRRSQPLSVCKMNQYSVLLFKFAEVLTEAEGHHGVGVLPLPLLLPLPLPPAASCCHCCLLLPPAASCC